MPDKDKEKKKAYQRDYYLDHREEKEEKKVNGNVQQSLWPEVKGVP